MFKDMYKDFHNEHIPYHYPHSFQEHKHPEYLEGTKPTYEMSYGDTSVIPFQIDPCFISCNIDIILYNFRYEELYRVKTRADASGKVYLDLSAYVSATYLKSGMYYISLQAYAYLQDGSPYVSTLIPPSDCSI